MAEILPIRRKTLSNQSTILNSSRLQFVVRYRVEMRKVILNTECASQCKDCSYDSCSNGLS